MLEFIILGTVQGIAEWLPVSSEGLIFLLKTNFFASGESLSDILKLALFLHLGTFLASLVYFRKDILVLGRALLNFKQASKEHRAVIVFLIITTIITAVLGFGFMKWAESSLMDVALISKNINLIIGGLLLITAVLQLRAKKSGDFGKGEGGLRLRDGASLGVAQSLAALPGLSRSGLTVSALLLSKFQEKTALRLSFLMSMPVVLGGNILFNLGSFDLNINSLMALLAAFIFGLLTISFLLKLASKVNFGIFVLIFAVLMIASYFI